MHITIEQNKEVVNLDAEEFPKHRLKFRNLDRPVNCACEFREFGGKDITANLSLLPMHLCRTIGEGRHAPTGGCCRKPGKAVFGIL